MMAHVERSAATEELYRWPSRPLSNDSLLAYQARPLGIEFPIGDQISHHHSVVPRTQTLLMVELVRILHVGHVELNSEPGFSRHVDEAAFDFERPENPSSAPQGSSA